MSPRMKATTLTAVLTLLAATNASAQHTGAGEPVSTIPLFSTEHIGRQGFVHVGGQYVEHEGEHYMQGSMYVDVWEPREITQPYPIVFLHGAGQTATYWQQTPDGRPGWAYYLIEQGYTVFMPDFPARGRSIYVPGVDRDLQMRSAERICCSTTAAYTNGDEFGEWPRHERVSQWPGEGTMGDPVFDAFFKTQVEFTGGGGALIRDAYIALLDRIGSPVILLAHSQGGGIVWAVADARPDLVRGIVAIEPSGPPMQAVNRIDITGRERRNWGPSGLPMTYEPAVSDPSEFEIVLEDGPDGPDLITCYMQQEPARQLANLSDIPAMITVGDASYHYIYDHCTAKWLNQAGVDTDYLPLDSVGIMGNAHEMMVERNSDEVVRFIEGWIRENVH
ncbi:MAG: alpha/beta fold hydrolase [Gammaproteobacteria bacterium]|nr:alpha/beta fold hydrolase [Gammaproteobacteria bacterium]